jgi:DNA polymerase I-like protein with 3'-5' exonuclease and polymerase domains
MNILTLDGETTIFQKGNPFSLKNKLVCIGFKSNDEPVRVVYDDEFDVFRNYLQSADLLIGFNIKFDLSWFQRYDIYNPYLSNHRIWDCQLVEFLLNQQSTPYPSLEDSLVKYNLGHKSDTIAVDYWDKGIDTDSIPREVINDRVTIDVEKTYELYLHQKRLLKPSMARLASLQCQDLVTLQQMEFNGLWLDCEASLREADKLSKEIIDIEQKLNELLEIKSEINWSSNDHISVLLYGGKIDYEKSVQVGFYKTGKRAGEPKFKKVVYEVFYDRLVEPIEGSELKKAGYWSVDQAVLGSLSKKGKVGSVISLLNRHSEISKLNNTYLKSFPELITTMDWEPNTIHGQFNQCVARTGRLSSSKPNLQNIPPELKQFIRSKYET